MNLTKILIAIAISLVIIVVTFIGGCQHGKKLVICPTIITGTTVTGDTTTHHIYHIWPWYIQGKDSVVYVDIPANIDTAFILRDYFAKHIFPRKWENDTLLVNISDTISQNTPIGNAFSYKIKTPFTTTNNSIDNSVTYSRYFNIGMSTIVNDINYSSFRAMYIWEKGNVSVGYSPMGKSITLDAGYNLLKFKKKK